MCEENKTDSDGVTIVTKEELLESAQKGGNISENRGCKFHPGMGS